MDNKNNILNDGIEIIDDFTNTSDQTNVNNVAPTINKPEEILMDDYIKDDSANNQASVGPVKDLMPDNMPEPDLLSDFKLDMGPNNNDGVAIPNQTDTPQPIVNPTTGDIPIVESDIPVQPQVVSDANNAKAIETLNTAEIIDPKLTVPVGENQEEGLAIAQESKKEIDNKKGMIFIAVLFVLLVAFIFTLPQISGLVKQITG